MAYCEVADLLVGDMPLPRGMKPQSYVDSAADEIDSVIGFQYSTPIDITSDNTPVVRPVCLLLKRLNVMLASGRLIMAMSTGSQRTELHAYGSQLVREALGLLQQIASGEIVLIGAPLADPDETPASNVTGPLIGNVDAESNVESFYARIANPNYTFGYPYGQAAGGIIAGG